MTTKVLQMTEAYANIGRCPANMNLILAFSYIGIPMEVTIKANTGVIRVQSVLMLNS